MIFFLLVIFFCIYPQHLLLAMPLSSGEKVRVYPEEWREPILLCSFVAEVKTRDIELEYRILRFLTENKKMLNRLHQGEQMKDRYKDVLPFSESRVHLSPAPSDYVNASWLPNFDGSNPRAFIASQGPLRSTLGDHWDMIVDNNVKAVFAIGNVSEGTVEKFAQYWPVEGELHVSSARHGDIVICLEKQFQVSPHMILRQLQVRCGTAGSSSAIHHYHFTSWPDYSAMEPSHFLELAGRMRFWRMHASSSPILVHCSAGVGRTGCAITLCNVIEDLEVQLRDARQNISSNRSISILEHAIHLRRYRMYMLQTTSQYVSVYRTVGFLLGAWQPGVPVLDVHEFADGKIV